MLIGVLLFVAGNVFAPKIFLVQGETVALAGRYTPNELPEDVLSLISSGLTVLDDTGVPHPALAESWEAQEEGKTWKFTLADNIFWQDKTPVTSSTISYNFNDVEIETPDPKTIIFKLKDPFSPFPVIVSKPVFKKGLLGTGDWRVQNLLLSSSYVEKLVLQNDELNLSKTIKFYPTEDRAKLAFKLGEVNKIEGVLDQSPFNNWNTVQINESVNTSRFAAVFFNTSDELLNDKDVRQALSYAIDKDKFHGSRVLGPIPPNSWAYNPQIKPYKFSVDDAKERIAKSELSPEQKKGFEIKLVTTPILLPVAEQIAKEWEEAINVKATVQVSSILPEDYQAFLTYYDVSRDPDQYTTWHSSQESTNISHYKSVRVDKLLEDGRVELDLEKRKAIYLDFQRFLLEDAPAAFLYHPQLFTITRK